MLGSSRLACEVGGQPRSLPLLLSCFRILVSRSRFGRPLVWNLDSVIQFSLVDVTDLAVVMIILFFLVTILLCGPHSFVLWGHQSSSSFLTIIN